ncbi:MAG: metal-dependent hydrolase [Saprospiraceae bacterium]
MDSFTHVFLGGCLGHLALGKRAGRKAIWWGALADTVPDLDIFSGFFVHPVDALLIHRGFTHSILFAVLFSFVGGIGLARLYKKEKIPWDSWCLVLALGIFSHLFIDSLTNYGTGLLEPFNGLRFSYATIFIADPTFTFPLLIAFFVLIFKRPTIKIKTLFSSSALFMSSLYLVFTFFNKVHFESYFKKQFDDQHIPVLSQRVAPSPFNNILWGVMGKTDSGYYSGYHSLFSKTDTVHFIFIPGHDVLAEPWKGQHEFELLRRFTQGYSCLNTGKDGMLYFNDLRDGVVKGWVEPFEGFNFSYPLVRDQKDSMHLIKANPWSRSGFNGMQELWKKMWGK